MTLRIQSILVPVDFSPCSEQALCMARELAEKLDARITVIHVVHIPLPAAADAGDLLVDYEGLQRSAERTAEGAMKRMIDACGLTGVEVVQRVGEPVRTILEEAARVKADLLVMGTHGRSGLARLVMGSVTDRVLRASPVPVLSVREREGAPWPFDEAPEVPAAP